MRPSYKHLIGFLWLFGIAITGCLMFTKGFLLKRLVIEKNSTCNVDFSTKADHHGADGCWMHSRFQKAVIVIIDALRFDFAYFNSSIPRGQELAYQNKLTIINELLLRKPHNARLYKFVADPPTTTMQRLKGLTTGSLPTFVDAGANFAKYEILEDNFIDQLLARNKKITFMGDDTWEGLFPGRWHRHFPFPSLVVHDLHTVDNGVIQNLIPELKRKDWDVLIAHFLGVDHCGHRYGPNHPAMADKLKQMDKELRSVIATLDDSTVLFVMGDHGMTTTGDHGGDSQNELDSSLFVYSPSFISSNSPQKGEHQTISQVDFVPTISLLLGLPIPYSNLGTIMTDLFNHCPWWKTQDSKVKQLYHSVKALRLNAHQINEYTQSYSKLADDFPFSKMTRLSELFRYCETRIEQVVTTVQLEGDHPNLLEELDSLKEKYIEYLEDVKEMCQNIWAKFDLNSMTVGFSLVCISMVTCLYWVKCEIVNGDTGESRHFALGFVVSVCCVSVTAAVYVMVSKVLSLIVVLVCANLVTLIFGFVASQVIESNNRNTVTSECRFSWISCVSLDQFVAHLLISLYGVAMFSNSYVVNEDKVSAFLLFSLIMVLFAKTSSNIKPIKTDLVGGSGSVGRSKKRFDLMRLLTSPRCIILGIIIICGVLIKLASVFNACREEQVDCTTSTFTKSLATLPENIKHWKNVRYFFSVCSICCLYYSVRSWLSHYGNLNGFSLSVSTVKYIQPILISSICFYWALQALPVKVYDSLPKWQLTVFPQVVYFCFFVSLGALIFSPLTVYVLPQQKSAPQFFDTEDIVPRIYNHIKMNYQQYLKSDRDDEKPPLVYGLATVFSASQLIVLTCVSIVLMLLLGDGMAPTVLLLVALIALVLELSATETRTSSQKDVMGLTSIYTLAFIGTVGFFSTGHQTVITTIRWEAAYHGFLDTFESHAIPAALITMNTFSSYILTTLALPLLVLWPYAKDLIVMKYSKYKELYPGLGGQTGEFSLWEDGQSFDKKLFQAFLGYTLFFLTRLLATMGCAAIHRRHLMVWKIFAPRLVYEMALFVLLGVVLCFVYIFTKVLERAVTSWARSLSKKS